MTQGVQIDERQGLVGTRRSARVNVAMVGSVETPYACSANPGVNLAGRFGQARMKSCASRSLGSSHASACFPAGSNFMA